MDTNCTPEVDWARHHENIEAARIGSAKINRLIAQARNLGLEVEVEVTEEASQFTSGTYRVVEMRVQRPREEAINALVQAQQSERLWVSWVWCLGNGATPKVAVARLHHMFSSEDVRPSHLRYAIEGMVR